MTCRPARCCWWWPRPQMDAERKEKEALEAKLTAMESKLLQGGVNLLDKVRVLMCVCVCA